MNTALAWTLGVFAAIFIIERLRIISYWFQAKKRKCGSVARVWSPFFGNHHSFILLYWYLKRDFMEMFRRAYNSRYGRAFWIEITGRWMFFTYEPENVKAMLATQFKDFSLGQRHPVMFPILGNGIFTLSGEGWKHSRAILRPQFKIEQVAHLDNIKEHVETLIERLGESSPTNLVDAQELFHCLTLDTATDFLFGESTHTLKPGESTVIQGSKYQVSGEQFGRCFGEAQELLAVRLFAGELYRMFDTRNFRLNGEICANFIEYFVNKTLQAPLEKDDVTENYTFIKELTRETRDPTVIRDQAINILLAGRDTTASTQSFMMALLSTHKHVWRKLREVVLQDFGEDGSTITFESLKRCKYLNNVINETLRLFPIVAINFRTSIKDTTLPRGGGPKGDQPVFVPKDTMCFYSPYYMHRDPEFWGENCDEFIPERWDEPRGHTWDFLPFNGGPRICLGQQFALTELGITTVRLCQEFEDFTTQLSCGDLRNPEMHVRLTISVKDGVPSHWTRAKKSKEVSS